MHKELLSDRERIMLNEYLRSGKKGKGFRLLKLRVLKYDKAITQDYELLQKAKEAFNG